MRMKVQDNSSTATVKKVHQVLMLHIGKCIASTLIDVDHHRIGRKTIDLRGKKVRIEYMTPGEIISKPEVATLAEAEAGAEVKKNHFIVCSTRKILTI
jgi:hypothetical protein